MLTTLKTFFQQHTLPIIACVAAIVSACFVPPNAGYIDYFDFKTLCCLFCISALVNALVQTGIFNRMGARVLCVFKTQRACVVALVTLTLVGAMFITNDMALLTFLPFSYLVLKNVTDKPALMVWCFVLQNAAAVLGGMILPFGNPHNLYLYSLFEIETGLFIQTMLPTFLGALVLIYGCCFVFVKPEPLINTNADYLSDDQSIKGNNPRLAAYLFLFLLTLLAVLRIVPYVVVTLVVIVFLLALNPAIFKKVDWGLLVTFAAFFVFAGNVTHIEAIRNVLCALLDQNALLTSVLTCQVISNLPTTLLYAPFISGDMWPTLLVATDIAGMGTPIASLASLITIGTFLNNRPEDSGLFFRIFVSVGFGFLIVLTGVAAFTL